GLTSDLTLGGTVTNTAGHTSLAAGRDILVNANISATTVERKTIDLSAGDDIIMGASTTISSTNGNIRLEATNTNAADDATTNGIALRTITAGTGHVALITGTAGSIVDAANTADANITANGLIMTAGTGIGSGTNHIDTTVTTLTATAGAGGVFVTESDTLVVDTLNFNVSRVNAQAGVADQNSAQEDLTTTSDGAVVVSVNAGGLTINDGT
ncbi:hypothetical protein, partial [Maribrevibacterium harenarium]|uniref:hypothetical protein n=1 Tax=Maribrevibacterium harenarium TaxID=2589817 RepID=UPI0015E437C4